MAATPTSSPGELRDLRIQLIADAAAAVVVLIVATGLSIYKPRGLTAYGWRKLREEKRRAALLEAALLLNQLPISRSSNFRNS